VDAPQMIGFDMSLLYRYIPHPTARWRAPAAVSAVARQLRSFV